MLFTRQEMSRGSLQWAMWQSAQMVMRDGSPSTNQTSRERGSFWRPLCRTLARAPSKFLGCGRMHAVGNGHIVTTSRSNVCSQLFRKRSCIGASKLRMLQASKRSFVCWRCAVRTSSLESSTIPRTTTGGSAADSFRAQMQARRVSFSLVSLSCVPMYTQIF